MLDKSNEGEKCSTSQPAVSRHTCYPPPKPVQARPGGVGTCVETRLFMLGRLLRPLDKGRWAHA
eukprot:5457842-Prorocentrum_lima.AAC.1